METIKCNTCGIEKSVDEFYKGSLQCKMCKKARVDLRKRWCVYMILNTIINKNYTGYTSLFNKRKGLHIHHLKKGVHNNTELQQDWIKYGESAFTFTILDYCNSKEEAMVREEFLINVFNANGQYTNYNKTNNKINAKISTERGNQKRSGVKCKKPINQYDAKTNELIKTWDSGVSYARAYNLHRDTPRNSINVKCLCGGYRLEYSDAQTNGINQYDAKTNELIKTWHCSMKDISKQLNMTSGNLSTCLNGKQKTLGGFIWKWNVEEPKVMEITNEQPMVC